MHAAPPRRCLLLWVALCAAACVAEAIEPRPLGQLDLRVWTTDHGLPHDTVLSLAQTSDGMLWAGTWAGLARFDGVEFRVYDRDNTPALDDNGILTVLADGSALYAGTRRGGLVRIAGGGVARLAPAAGPIGGHVLAMAVAADGLWVGTEEAGLYRWDGAQIEAIRDPLLDGRATVLALAVAADGSLLVGTTRGAWRIDAARATARALPAPPGLADRPIAGIAESGDGSLWLSGEGGVYQQGIDGTWRRRYAGAATALRVDRGGAVWAGTPTRGALRFTGERTERVGPADGLPDNRVRTTLQDQDGNYWLGGNGGLVGLQALAFRAIGARHGLGNLYVRSALEDGTGVWVGTAGGLYRVRDDIARRVGAEAGIESVLSLGRLANGDLLLGTYDGGVLALDRAERPYPLPGLTLPGRQVRALLRARDGVLWVGSQGGPVRYDPAAGRTLPALAGAPTSAVIALHEDAGGNVWVGASSGLFLLRAGASGFTALGAASGYPADATFAFLDDGADALLLGTDAGLVRHVDGRWQRLGREHGLPFHSVMALLRDGSGNLWLGADGGVLRIAHAAATEFWAGHSTRIDYVLYGRDEGMPSQQINGSAGPNAIQRRDGEIWFATARGIAAIDPGTVDADPPPPPMVAIARARIDDLEVDPARAHRLPPGAHTVSVNFAAIALTRQGQIEYAYRVRGLDDDWRSIGSERSLRLAALPPGDYRLEVAARYRRGALSREPAVLAFAIAPHPWQRPWFYPALAGLIVLATFAAFRARTAALRAREAQLSRLVDEKTEALAVEMRRLAERDAEKGQLLEALRRTSAELERLAREDGLTGVANRRHFDQRFAELFETARGGGALAVALIDIDHFKRINDGHSHQVGDRVLQRFAALLQEAAPQGLVARYGGEEFVLALPGLDLAAARECAEAIRARVAAAAWQELAAGLAVTCSIGVAAMAAHAHPDRLLAEADARLYEAKRAGRDRVV